MTKSSLRALFGPLLVAGLFLAPSARAAEPEDSATAEFQKGVEAVKADNCAEAIPHFRASIQKKPGVGARMNLADCYYRSSDPRGLADAYVQYQGAAQLAIAKNDTERAERAHKYGDELGFKVTHFHIGGLPANATRVSVDGREIDPSDYPLFKDFALEANKRHTIEADGGTPDTHFAQVIEPQAAGKVVEVDIRWPAAVTVDDPGKGRKRLGLIVGGVGVAGLVVGTIFGLVAISAAKDAHDTCVPSGSTGFSYPKNCAGGDPTSDGSAPTHGKVDSKNSTALSTATVSTVGFIAGGVLLAGGAALYLTAPSAASTAAARVRLAPSVAPGQAGLVLAGGW